MCLFALLGRWAGALGSACAVAGGFVAANYLFKTPGWTDGRVLPWKQVNESKPWEWLPRAALVLILVGLASRWLGLLLARVLPERRWWAANLFVWAPRVAAVVAVSGWLVSERWAAEHSWLPWALPVVMMLNWVVLDTVSRSGSGAEVAAYLSVNAMAVGAVLLYMDWAAVTEVAVMLGAALFGVTVAAWLAKTDASGAIPAAVAFLPALMVAGRTSAIGSVPLASFWLLALAPLTLSPFLIPRLAKHDGWKTRTARAVLILIPVLIALVLADQNAKLSFGDDW